MSGPETNKIPIEGKPPESHRKSARLRLTELKYENPKQVARAKNLAVDASINAIAFSDMKGRLIYVNNAFLKLWGYSSKSELFQKPAVQFWTDETAAQKVVETVKSEGKWTGQLLAVKKDGSQFYAHLSSNLITDDSGRNICLMTSFVDITNLRKLTEELRQYQLMVERDISKREKSERALAEEHNLLLTLIDNIPDFIYAKDLKSRYTLCNTALVKDLGASSLDEVLGKTNFAFDPPELAEQYYRREQQIIKTGQPKINYEEPLREHNGKKRFGLSTKIPLRDDKGEVVGLVGIGRDITKLKEAKLALQKAHNELEQRIQIRTAELVETNRKLLTYQKRLRSLASELLLTEERLRRQMAVYVHDHIGQNLAISKIKMDSMAQSSNSPELTGGLREVSNLTAQAIKSTRSLSFQLSPPVLYELGFEAAIEWLIRQTKQQHNLNVKFKGDGRCEAISHNAKVFLFQAVRELLVNVIKHAGAKTVTVSVKNVASRVKIIVTDDGIGFDTSIINDYDRQTAGFGLFSIRERLGYIDGQFNVSSKPGGGTRITLTAPIQARQNSKQAQDK